MRLPVAYRSLARPSSVLEPSHSPDGIATPKDKIFLSCPIYIDAILANRIGIPFAPSMFELALLHLGAALHSNSASKDNQIHSFNPRFRQKGVSSSPPTLLGECTKHQSELMKANL
jgi:hypothetical protein